jgi:hypothetical protein
MLQVFDSMGLDPVIVGSEKYDQGTSHGGVEIIRRGQESRDQAEEVGEEDKKAKGSDQGKEFPPPVSEDVIQKFQNHLGEEFEDIPQGKAIGWDERFFSSTRNGHFLESQIGHEAQDQEYENGHRNLVLEASYKG